MLHECVNHFVKWFHSLFFFFFFFKFSIRELSYQLKDCNWYNLQQHQYQHTTSYPAQHLHPCNKGSFSAVYYTPLYSFYKHLSCLFWSKMTYLPLLLNLWYSKQKRWKITKIMGVFYFWFCVNSIDTVWLNFTQKMPDLSSFLMMSYMISFNTTWHMARKELYFRWFS